MEGDAGDRPRAGPPAGIRFGQPSGGPNSPPGFGRLGAFAGVAVTAVLLTGLLWSAAAGHAVSAQHPRLFGGSLVLEDQRPLTVIDLATGQVTVRLDAVYSQVGAASYGEVQAVAVDEGTVLVDRKSGTFNLLGKDNYVLDAAGEGVGLGRLAGSTGAGGLAAGSGVYIVRYAPRSTVSLVDQATIEAGAKIEQNATVAARARTPVGGGPVQAVTPRGFVALGAPVADQPGSSAVANGDLWALVGGGRACLVQQLQPVASAHDGLLPIARGTLPSPCVTAAVEAVPGAVGVITPGHVRLFVAGQSGKGVDVAMPATATATEFLPVTGTTGTLWYLARNVGGWSIVGVTPAGRITGPARLLRLGPSSVPVTPTQSGGVLYTLDQAQPGQPTLWTILPANGAMIPVQGAATYPARSVHEKAAFRGAEVESVGPRVVFNNPGSLLAVVIFTDGSHAPVIIDKSSAVEVSAAGPADLNAAPAPPAGRRGGVSTHPAAPRPVPVAPVNQSVTCANTTQKPYAPQITSVVPASESALVVWSYQLLDQQDCEPDSWAVKMTALSGSHQPVQPVEVVNGQTQLQFTGLRPATTYQVAVTAYINLQSTPSTPATFTTAARGPDPPASVQTRADGRGHWVVSWAPCTAADCYVPADTWNVIGAACGAAFVGQPPTISVPGGQSSVTVDAGALGLLGDSLSFSVQGVLASGLTGNPQTDHTCTQAWRAPNPAGITLAAAGNENPATDTIAATLQIRINGAPVDVFGSHNTQFVYSVGGLTVGPTTATLVTVPGLAGGTVYTPRVRVYPTGHPAAAAVVTGSPFSQKLVWPPGLAVTVTTSVNANPNTGTLVFSFVGLPAGPMEAENGTITCGSTQYTGIPSGSLSGGTITAPFNLVNAGGTCDLSVVVSDTNTVAYGGVSSPPLQATFTIGTAPAYGFTDQIAPDCQEGAGFCDPEQIQVDFAGTEPAVLKAGANWAIASSSTRHPGSTPDPCAAQFGETQPARFPIIVTLPATCVHTATVDIQVSYRYLGQTVTVDAGTPSGTPGQPTTTTSTSTTSTSTSTTSTSTPASPTTTRTTRTTRTTIGAASGRRASLAAARLQPVETARPTLAGDPDVKSALLWTVPATIVAWCGAALTRRGRRRRRGPQQDLAGRGRRDRRPTKPPGKEPT